MDGLTGPLCDGRPAMMEAYADGFHTTDDADLKYADLEQLAYRICQRQLSSPHKTCSHAPLVFFEQQDEDGQRLYRLDTTLEAELFFHWSRPDLMAMSTDAGEADSGHLQCIIARSFSVS